jgi:hypothetical protein
METGQRRHKMMPNDIRRPGNQYAVCGPARGTVARFFCAFLKNECREAASHRSRKKKKDGKKVVGKGDHDQ